MQKTLEDGGKGNQDEYVYGKFHAFLFLLCTSTNIYVHICLYMFQMRQRHIQTITVTE